MNGSFESLFAWLLDVGWLATALLVAALGLRVLIRDPARRVTLAWGTWLAIVAGGILVALPDWPRIDVASLLATPRDETRVVVLEDAAAIQHVYLSVEPLEPAALPLAVSQPSASLPALSPAAIGARVWLVIAAMACGWLAMGLVRAWRLIARSQPVPEWISNELRQIVGTQRRRLPGLLTNKQIATAIALGTLRPRIVLPLASVSESNSPAVRAALAHEWAHIHSGDLWLLALERSLVPLLALHPLFWWLRRLTRLDQELAADSAAAGDKPAEYAEALLDWAKGEPQRHASVAALAMWERPSNLSGRIRMILDPNRKAPTSRSRLSACAVLATLFTLALVLSIVSWRPTTAQEQNPPPLPTQDIPPSQPTLTLPAPPAAEPIIMVELQLLSLDPRVLANANLDVKAALKRDSKRYETRETGIVWAELTDKDTRVLVDTLRDADGMSVISQPKLMTQNGQEAQIVIGQEVPIVDVLEIVNGEGRERRVEFKEVGTRFRVKPQIMSEDPRMVVLEIAGEQTTLNGERADGAGANRVPLLKSHKIQLRATIELGQTLVLLDTARDADPDAAAAADPDKPAPPAKDLLILLRPSVVEHKYVEVYPDPAAAIRVPAMGPQPIAFDFPAFADGEAALAQQLRQVRMVLEQLALEREQSRQEHAALKQELEQLKSKLHGPPKDPQSSGNIPSNATPPVAVTSPSSPHGMARPAPHAKPAPLLTRVYVFAGNKEAADAVRSLVAGWKVEDQEISANLKGNSLIVSGPEAALTKAEHALQAIGAGKLAMQTRGTATDAVIVADPNTPHATVQKAIQWRYARQPDGQWTVEDAANVPSERDRRTHRRLLELDLQAAELELQAAQEDFEAAQKLYEQKAVSAEELRGKRRAVDRTRIQVAKLTVLIEADEEQPAAKQVPAPPR